MRTVLFVALAAVFVTPAAADCLRPRIEPLRLAVERSEPKEDLATNVPTQERDAIAALKASLRIYVANTVTCVGNLDELKKMLALGASRLKFQVRRLAPDLIGVVANFGLHCVGDNTLAIFARRDRQWREVLHLEAPPYKSVDGAWDMFGYEVSPPDKAGKRFVVTRTVAGWCSSTWSTIRYALWRPGHDAPLFQGSDPVWWGGEDYGRLTLGASDFEIRFHSGSVDSGRHNREWVRHFALKGDTAVRVAPVADSVQDFVEEWIQSDWKDARGWTAPALVPAVRAVHAKFHANPYGEYKSIRRCGGDTMEIELNPSGTDDSLFFQVRGTRDFRLTGLANAARCGGKNLYEQQH